LPQSYSPKLVLGLACLITPFAGCDRAADDRLVIATSWPAAERRGIESEFAGWLEQRPDSAARRTIRVAWLILSPGDDVERLAARRNPPDVVLGGPARAFDRLARAKRLSPLPIDGSPAWAVARRGIIRWFSGASEGATPSAHRHADFDDPRKAPVSLAWAEGQLEGRAFPEGYARLIRASAESRRIGRLAGSAASATERGEAEQSPRVTWGAQDATSGDGVPWVDGVAILAEGRHPDEAATFLKFLAATGRAGMASLRSEDDASDESRLLADLLGATLVDAQDELWAAWSALERAGSPPGQLHWMTEPPPWPPASIAKIQDRQGEQAMTMIETLAGQLATEPALRAWLVRSWLSPARPIDRRFLAELAQAVDGRLIREPRFRDWLRAEWTAWARQRYRRVLRSVGGR
jgi:hypothetical protein